ncbi:class I SAM-dependent methyltransferase [Candidatus Saccharibacteria bacterium]|nr:class I SAM-dependent methyltransferase [Candidatus Saccharibacteria bacterium]
MDELTDDEKVTLDAYNSKTTSWAAAHDDEDFWENEMKMFKKLLPKGDLLEVGVGSGRDARFFIRNKDYSYLGTDVSTELLRVAKTRNPAATFLESSIYSLPKLGKKFDGFWCAAVLLHIPRNRLLESLQSLAQVTKTGGIGFISTKLGAGDGFEPYSADKEKSRLIVYYSKEELESALIECSFEILWDSVITERHNKWQSFIIRKN